MSAASDPVTTQERARKAKSAPQKALEEIGLQRDQLRPFILSLSKGLSWAAPKGFDRLNPNGVWLGGERNLPLHERLLQAIPFRLTAAQRRDPLLAAWLSSWGLTA